MKPLLSLCMILKDEASSIREVLEAVRPWIDRWTILDTGSTDGTQDIVEEVMRDVPGGLCKGAFIDFATARNEVLRRDWSTTYFGRPPEQGELAVFQLMLSGDEYLRDGAALRDHLEKHRDSDVDCHFVKVMIDGVSLYRPIVLRTGSAWRYEGVVHEVPFNRVDPKAPSAAVPDAWIDHRVADPERRLNNIWETHIPLLEAAVLSDPTDARSLIFLAQSYDRFLSLMEGDELVEYARKSIELYTRRLLLPIETADERGYVEMRRLDAMRVSGDYTAEQLFAIADELCAQDPKRAETALLRAEIATKVPNVPVRKVYDLAHHAATVASEAANAVSTSPVDLSCCWRAHQIAAVAAKQIAAADPDYAERMREHIRYGLEAGGFPAMFQAIDEAAVGESA